VIIDGERRDVFRHEYEPMDELEALEKKAANGCSKHDGNCDCGAKGKGRSGGK